MSSNDTKKLELLDCTLRDGAYIVDAHFGVAAIKGILKKLQESNMDIIECGWLKDFEHEKGTTFYHVPSDVEQYLDGKNDRSTYVVMIDWDRYDVDTLPEYDGKSIDAVRVVFPYGKHKIIVRGVDQKRLHSLRIRLIRKTRELEKAIEEAEAYLETVEDPVDRNILRLRCELGMEWKEVAEKCGNTENACKVRFHRLMKKLEQEESCNTCNV